MGETAVKVPVPELSPSTRAALIIATAQYDDPAFSKLRSPVRDAAELAAVLSDPAVGGFTVTTVVDQSDSQVRLAIAQFLGDRSPDETVLVYVSCHGIQDQAGRLYFATTDTVKAHPRVSAVKAADLQEELDECRARQQILILDCCFSGAFGDGRKGDVDLEDRLVRPGRGRVVLTASRSYEYSFEGEAIDDATPGGSVFTTGLVEGLRTGDADADSDGYVAWDEAFAYADRYVQNTGARQTPQQWLSGGEGAKIILARSPAGQLVVPVPLPEDIASDLTSRLEYVRIGAVNEVARWLTDPHPPRVLAATMALLDVAEHDNPRVAAAARACLEQTSFQATPSLAAEAPDASDSQHETGDGARSNASDEEPPPKSDNAKAGYSGWSDWQQRDRDLPISRFLIWVSGADSEILQLFPADRAKYVAYGSMITVTSLLAGWAVYFVLYEAFVENLIASAAIAILFGLFVMVVDRWLIVTMSRRAGVKSTFLTSAPRIAFGLLLSVIIAGPIILQVFRPEIRNQLMVTELQRSSDFSTQVTTSALGQRIKADQERVSQLVNIISNPHKESATAVSVAKSELPQAQHVLAADEEQENQLESSFASAVRSDNGLLAAISALITACSHNGVICGASIALFLLFMIVNLLPIIVKTLLSLGPASAYERAAAYGEDIGLQAAAIVRERQVNRIIGKRA